MEDPMDSQLSGMPEQTREGLVAKCQENGWLKRGGYAWQDDPFLEEYPYSFVAAKDIDDLADFFRHGNWALRQGVVYHDLAFVQQVDGGDEWWTLKHDGEGWVDFESVSCGRIARRDPENFANLVAAMRTASVGQCRRLEYLPDSDGGPSVADVLVSRIVDISDDFFPCEIRGDVGDAATFRAHVEEILKNTPEIIVARLEELATESDVSSAQALADTIRKSADHVTSDGRPLAQRAEEAKSALESMNPEREREAHERVEI